MPTRTASLYATSSSALDRSSASSLHTRMRQSSEYAINTLATTADYHDAYHGILQHHRRRLSSTGETSGDSSTTTSGSSCGEREDGSEGCRAEEAEDNDHRLSHHHQDQEAVQGQVTEAERQQIETFFHGLKTEVYVCTSLANLYTKTTATDWELRYTGIPVILLDMGEARSRNKRRIQIVLAERGSSFMLWRDTIDNLSSYKVAGRAFHTMCLSSDHSQEIGLSFDTNQAANDMWSHIERLVSCPENISLSAPGKKKKKKEKKPQKPARLPPKSHISQPCCFQHVTSVEIGDRSRYYSLQELVPTINEISASLVSPTASRNY